MKATFYFTAEDGRDPLTFELEHPVKTKLLKLMAYVQSREGRHDLGALLAAAVAVYSAVHRAGV